MIERIKSFGIRKLEKAMGIHHDTIILICKGRAVKPRTLRNVIQFLDAQQKENETPKFSEQIISNGSILYAETDGLKEAQNNQ